MVLLLNGPVYIELSSSYLMLTTECVSAIECCSKYLILGYILNVPFATTCCVTLEYHICC